MYAPTALEVAPGPRLLRLGGGRAASHRLRAHRRAPAYGKGGHEHDRERHLIPQRRTAITDHAQDFADRLTTFEQDRDVDAFVSAAFSPDVVLLRPETGQELRGHDGARTFWSEYLTTFEQVRSTFSRVQDGTVGVLEWTSEASLSGGRDITYRGASLLDVDDDGLVERFATYYDTRLFQPTAS